MNELLPPQVYVYMYILFNSVCKSTRTYVRTYIQYVTSFKCSLSPLSSMQLDGIIQEAQIWVLDYMCTKYQSVAVWSTQITSNINVFCLYNCTRIHLKTPSSAGMHSCRPCLPPLSRHAVFTIQHVTSCNTFCICTSAENCNLHLQDKIYIAHSA